jgi:catechol 2,3-dioxygenase-like lactoylglutathione lyase family enzyme
MNVTVPVRPSYDRTSDDLGNVVEFGHVNVTVPDQGRAISFYVAGLGLTRDPFMMPGVENIWVNAGRNAFHLPTRDPQVLRGTIGLVIPNLEGLLRRLKQVRPQLAGTRFDFREADDAVEATCPWSNRFRCHAPDPARFGTMRLGMPYVDFDVSPGTDLAGIERFYRDIFDAITGMAADARGPYAWVRVADGSELRFHEGRAPLAPFDGHHIQFSLANFSRPYRKLLERGLITEETNRHQYRFVDIVDVDTNKVLFQVEHEVRSMLHPMFTRALINRNPDLTLPTFVPGYEYSPWALN